MSQWSEWNTPYEENGVGQSSGRPRRGEGEAFECVLLLLKDLPSLCLGLGRAEAHGDVRVILIVLSEASERVDTIDDKRERTRADEASGDTTEQPWTVRFSSDVDHTILESSLTSCIYRRGRAGSDSRMLSSRDDLSVSLWAPMAFAPR